MRGKRNSGFFRDKGVIIALVICLLAAGTITGIYTMRQSSTREDSDFVDLSQLDEEQEDSQEAANDQVANPEPEPEEEPVVEEPVAEDVQETSANEIVNNITRTITMDFSEDDKLAWPVSGDVIMNYSMDKTIHFSTLDVYKYNPAIVISSEINTKVLAAANGKVSEILVNEETGNTVILDLGNGYEAVYGQLKEVPLEVGDVVETNELIGYVSEPTKYYSVEGSNLYFELRRDGEPVNPMDYLE